MPQGGERGGRHTDPLQILPVFRADLILQHGEQVAYHAQAFGQESDSLVHLEIAADGCVDGLQARFGPHQFRGVEHGTLQVDVDAEDEELADLLVDFAAAEGDGAGEGDLLGEGLRHADGCREEVFEEGCLDGLGQGVGDGEFGHVVFFLAEGDEVVVDAGLVLAGVVEIEVFGLDVGGGELFGFEPADFGEEASFLRRGHAPDYDSAVVEEEDFRGVHCGVEIFGPGVGR